ncbi:hypothetical protein [Nocardioides sp. HB32]
MIGRLVAMAYVGAVAGLAGAGFAGDSTVAILSATALALPSGLAGLVAFYAAYGLLALVPGANPDASSGSGSCNAAGACESSSSGDLASWFQITTDAIGVFMLTAAAITNVLVAHWLLTRSRRARSRPAAGGRP